MESKYIITSDGKLLTDAELYHWGIKGMKWGVRRYQNPDGSLTEKGKKRYMNPDGSLNKKGQKKFGNSVKKVMERKSAKDMTDEELDRAIIRARKEEEYNRLHPEPKPKQSVLMNEVIKPAAVNAGRNLVSKLMNQAVEKLTAGKVDPNSLAYLREKADRLDALARIRKHENPQDSWDDKLKAQQWRKNEQEWKDAQAKRAKNSSSEETTTTSNKKRFKVKRIVNNYSSKPASSTRDSDYEKRVDELLAEMDNRGWETYYRDYANRRDDD